jgi:hypothetical protein
MKVKPGRKHVLVDGSEHEIRPDYGIRRDHRRIEIHLAAPGDSRIWSTTWALDPREAMLAAAISNDAPIAWLSAWYAVVP